MVHVRNGEEKPYSCASGFYTRIGPNAQKMNRNQIIEFFQSEGQIRFEELINLKFKYPNDYDEQKVDNFLKLAGISKVLDTPSILINLGVAEKQGGELIFNNTGVLLFAKNLNDIYPHANITCALYKGVEKVNVLDRKDFNNDIISNVDDTMLFLKQHIQVRYEFDGSPKRIEIPELPFEALREAVINAVCHRYYFEKGANVMVEVFDDRIEISSPGGLVKGLLEKDFGKRSVLRNPKIAALFHRIGYIEKMGTGISRIQNLIREAGLQPVVFRFTAFVTAVFKRSPVIHMRTTQETTQEKILLLITEYPEITRAEMAKSLGLTSDGVKYHLGILRKKNIIRHVGPTKKGRWEIIEKG